MIPEGQDLRQHYHCIMQIAGTAGEDGMTHLYKSREISASRMANHRTSKPYMRHTKRASVKVQIMKVEAGETYQANKQQPPKSIAQKLCERGHPPHTTKGTVNTKSQTASAQQRNG